MYDYFIIMKNLLLKVGVFFDFVCWENKCMKIVRVDNKATQLTILTLLFITFFMPSSFSLTVGSNSAVSVETQPTFPTKTDNIILGFARMENGFLLADQNTTCTFQDFFHVAGSVNLSGGTLVLAEDLTFDNPLGFQNGGIILGNAFAFELPRAIPNTTLVSGGGGNNYRI